MASHASAGERDRPPTLGLSEQDIDLRKLRYFLAVATESNFGRAAARLHMTQPALSRQIQSLETEVGVRLFDRDRQGARLTSAGEQFRKDAEQLLELSVAAQRRARQAARSPSLFSVGFMPGVPSTPIVREFGKSVPRLEISVVYTALTDQVDYLLDGRVDVCFVRLPIPSRLFEIVPLFMEQQVIALAADHPLAGSGSLSPQAMSGLECVDPDGLPPDMRGYGASLGWRVPVEEQLEKVALGTGYAVLPAGIAGFYHRPDVSYLPATGVDEIQVALAQDKTRKMPEFQLFARIAQRLLGVG